MSNSKKFLTGFLTGGVIAGITVLSTTKYSGKELRDKIASTIQTCQTNQDYIKSTLSSLKNQLVETSQICSASFGEFTSGVKDTITKWKGSTDPNVETIQQEIHSIKEEIEHLERKLKQPE